MKSIATHARSAVLEGQFSWCSASDFLTDLRNSGAPSILASFARMGGITALLNDARHVVASDKHERLVYVAAWNEWTEDHALLPDTYWAYSYLEALRRAAKDDL